MKKKLAFYIFYGFVLFVVLANVAFYVKDAFFFTLEQVPQGELVFGALAPDGEKSANFYRVVTADGTGARVQVMTFANDGAILDTKTVYWAVDTENVTLSWENDHVLVVDDYALDLEAGDTYDCRRHASFSQKW